jgi:hypothetical protein
MTIDQLANENTRRTVFSGMLCGVDLVRTDVSEKFSVCFIRVTRIGELGTALALTSNRRRLRTWYFFSACVGWYYS